MTLMTADPVLALHHLSFAPEGDDVVVGRRDIDSYGVFPPDGAALVRELAAGRPVADAARWYEQTYGEPVDVDALRRHPRRARVPPPAGRGGAAAPRPVRWQRLGRALFSPVALVLYGDGRRRRDRDLGRRSVVRPASRPRVLRRVVRHRRADDRDRPAAAVGDPRARPPAGWPPARPAQPDPPVQPLLLRRVRDDARRPRQRAPTPALPADARRDGRRPRGDGGATVAAVALPDGSLVGRRLPRPGVQHAAPHRLAVLPVPADRHLLPRRHRCSAASTCTPRRGNGSPTGGTASARRPRPTRRRGRLAPAPTAAPPAGTAR